MAITDELREWARNNTVQDKVLTTYPAQHPVHGTVESLLRIADRIDAEHQKAIRELNNLADASVLLPVDADGEYIHVGDVMDSRVDYLFDGKPFTVRALVLCEDGWEVADGRFGNRYEPNSLRHHHAPTVEDVLRGVVTLCHNTWKEESAFHFYGVDDVMESGNIAEYAAKLRLAGSDAE